MIETAPVTAPPPSSGPRNAAIDGLRGVAALSVALGHCVVQVTGMALWATSLRDFPLMPPTDIAMRVLSALFPSDAAVMVFFVLSGHVLWGSFQRKRIGFFAGLADHICARTYRLFPLTIVSAIPLGLLTAASASELDRFGRGRTAACRAAADPNSGDDCRPRRDIDHPDHSGRMAAACPGREPGVMGPP